MAGRNSIELLREISSAATDILRFVDGLSFESFMRLPATDSLKFRAIKNAVAEIGEAVKGLPPDLVQRHPSIDWRGLSGLRDVIAHQYYRFDIERLWPMIKKDLPDLIDAVLDELERTQQSRPPG